MSDFNIAYDITDKFEGGYVNDSLDNGGETYRGISRKFNHKWPGWKIIDGYKTNPSFPKVLDSDLGLQTEIKNFYKSNYWDVFYGNLFTDQSLANELYDFSVNAGSVRSIQCFQIALNILNRDAKDYPDIAADGKFGKETFDTLTAYLQKNPPNLLLNVMVLLRGSHYLNIVQKNTSQEKYIRGWLKRIKYN